MWISAYRVDDSQEHESCWKLLEVGFPAKYVLFLEQTGAPGWRAWPFPSIPSRGQPALCWRWPDCWSWARSRRERGGRSRSGRRRSPRPSRTPADARRTAAARPRGRWTAPEWTSRISPRGCRRPLASWRYRCKPVSVATCVCGRNPPSVFCLPTTTAEQQNRGDTGGAPVTPASARDPQPAEQLAHNRRSGIYSEMTTSRSTPVQ